MVRKQSLHLCSSAVAACWFGSLCATGFMAVPLVFAHIQPAYAAGNLAAQLFMAQGALCMACCVLLLILWRAGLHPSGDPSPPGTPPDVQQLGLIIAGLLLAMLLQFAVAPHIVAREHLALWHRVGTALYVAQWLCALLQVLRLARSHE